VHFVQPSRISLSTGRNLHKPSFLVTCSKKEKKNKSRLSSIDMNLDTLSFSGSSQKRKSKKTVRLRHSLKEKQNLVKLHSNSDFLQNIRKFVLKMVELTQIISGKDFDAIESIFEMKDA